MIIGKIARLVLVSSGLALISAELNDRRKFSDPPEAGIIRFKYLPPSISNI